MPRDAAPPRKPADDDRLETSAGRGDARGTRGQTEPLAALVAISILAIAVGLYAAFLTGVLPGQSEAAAAKPVADNVWEDLQEEGYYPNATGPDGDRESYPERAVDTETIPPATDVYVVVTTTDDRGDDVVVGRVHFGPDGERVDPTDGPPETADTEVRSVPVEMDEGETRAGTLRVEVW